MTILEQDSTSNKSALNNAEPLNVATLPLTGKHLIEASAGTGKTFNITRIYLRMLLERKLGVEQILVMTFTKDATQELKGRIDSTLRDAIANWDSLIVEDEFYQSLSEKIEPQQAKLLLKKALLYLDEASIYTIHGFCQRVLTEHAFGTKMQFNASLEADLSEFVLQAAQDWYRDLTVNEPDAFINLSEFWPTPSSFLSSFQKAIYQTSQLEVLFVQDVIAKFYALINHAQQTLTEHQSIIEQALITSQKPAKQTERQAEFNELCDWLAQVQDYAVEQIPQLPSSFFDGRRYNKSPDKETLNKAFEPLKQIKKQQSDLPKTINRANAYALVRDGIYWVREKIKQQKALANVLGFDDLIEQLAKSLKNNGQLAQQVKSSFPVALVDEFQDTDPAQFAILESLYGNTYGNAENATEVEPSALFMIGDPKQAIYGFRGGDVFAYLTARQQCQYQWLMDTNWRSSKQMIAGYNRLFYGKSLTQPIIANDDVFGYNIPYLPVNASTRAKPELTLANNSAQQALQFIYFRHEDDNTKVAQSFRSTIAAWVADEITQLLTTDNKLVAQDIAILVRDGTEAQEIKQALEHRSLPSVYLSNRNNLFESKEAAHLLIVLNGILHCQNDRLFSAAVASPLLGYHAQAFYQLQQDQLAWQNLKFVFEDLKAHWLNKGFMSMALTLMHDQFNIAAEQKDRALTNLLHLFELLQVASQRHHQPHELLYWFEQHINGQASLTETELRLESDDNLIKIVTQHGSKGLEYPVVFVPFASRYKNPLKIGVKNVNLIEYHDEQGQMRLSLDGDEKAKQAMVKENHAETIRLLYVAITRAEQRCYIVTTDFENAHLSPIGLAVNAEPTQLLTSLEQVALNEEAIALTVIDAESVSAELTDLPISELAEKDLSQYQEAKFTSTIERDWWLSSFSALTRHVHHGIGEFLSSRDRDHLLADSQQDNSHLIQFSLKKGAQTGNFLHDILEHIDFAHPNWQDVLDRMLQRYQYILEDFSKQTLISWLEDVLQTPLIDGIALADIAKGQTLREAEFYFPMANANMFRLAKLLSEHRNFISTNNDQSVNDAANLSADSSTVSQIHLPMQRKLKGMMHGFIDLLVEINGKYYVCDYKSSHLGDSFSAYEQAALKCNIEENYYDLQYLLYSLALHRYLKSQLENYQFSEHFGGVLYLYLRGMRSQSENNTGVYFTKISSHIIEQLDQLFSDEEDQNTNVGEHNVGEQSTAQNKAKNTAKEDLQ